MTGKEELPFFGAVVGDRGQCSYAWCVDRAASEGDGGGQKVSERAGRTVMVSAWELTHESMTGELLERDVSTTAIFEDLMGCIEPLTLKQYCSPIA